MNLTKIFLAGVSFLIISFIIRQIEVIYTLNYYKMPEFFGIWSRLMMPSAGPPPVSFLLTSLLFSFLTGIVLAILYWLLKDLLPKKNLEKIVWFTGIVFVLSFVFFTLPVNLMLNVPSGLLGYWLLDSLIIFLLSSAVFVKILK